MTLINPYQGDITNYGLGGEHLFFPNDPSLAGLSSSPSINYYGTTLNAAQPSAGPSVGGLNALGGLGGIGAGLGALRLATGGSLTEGLNLGVGTRAFLADQLGTGATTAIGDAVSNFTSPLSGIGSFVANFALDKLMGNRGIGSDIGSTVGGIAGSFLPFPGGTILGSVIGNLIGGMFGAKPSVGPGGGSGLDFHRLNGRETEGTFTPEQLAQIAPFGGYGSASGGGDNGYDPTALTGYAASIPTSLHNLLVNWGLPTGDVAVFPNVNTWGQISVGGKPSGSPRLLDIEQPAGGGGAITVGIGADIGLPSSYVIPLSSDASKATDQILLGILQHVDITGVDPAINTALKASKATSLDALFKDIQPLVPKPADTTTGPVDISSLYAPSQGY